MESTFGPLQREGDHLDATSLAHLDLSVTLCNDSFLPI